MAKLPKIERSMTPKQREQFNWMLSTLRSIAAGYETPKQLRKSCEKLYGLEYEEALEMAYENIQSDAKRRIKGIKMIP